MKILALILARGGSKRLPGKNIRELGGKPLIAWSIELARSFEEIADILVSSDSEEIAAASRVEGALVPWLRPQHLSTDEASSADAAIHSLDWYESERGPVDGLMLLQPTSPFRRFETVEKALALFESNPLRPVVSVSPVHPHPAWCFLADGEELVPVLGWDGLGQRSQDLESAFSLNGAIYLVSPASLRKENSFFTRNFQPLMMEDELESLDIDTEWDWLIAEECVKHGLGRAHL